MSVTLDTNICVSALEFGGLGARILWMARAGVLRIDVSDAIVEELVTVLRDDFAWDGCRLHFAKEQIAGFTNRVKPTRKVYVVEADPDDNAILECAAAGGSEWIVTGDKDLLRLGSFENIRIVRGAEFLKIGLPREGGHAGVIPACFEVPSMSRGKFCQSRW